MPRLQGHVDHHGSPSGTALAVWLADGAPQGWWPLKTVVCTKSHCSLEGITASQHCFGWKGPPRSSSPTISPTLPSAPPNHVPKQPRASHLLLGWVYWCPRTGVRPFVTEQEQQRAPLQFPGTGDKKVNEKSSWHKKENILASCFLKTPWEVQPSPGPALHPETAFAPAGCGKLCWVELLRFLLFVQGP